MLNPSSVLEINIGIICGAVLSFRHLFGNHPNALPRVGARIGTLSRRAYFSTARARGAFHTNWFNTGTEKEDGIVGASISLPLATTAASPPDSTPQFTQFKDRYPGSSQFGEDAIFATRQYKNRALFGGPQVWTV